MKRTKTITREFDVFGRCVKEVIVEDDGAPTHSYTQRYFDQRTFMPCKTTILGDAS